MFRGLTKKRREAVNRLNRSKRNARFDCVSKKAHGFGVISNQGFAMASVAGTCGRKACGEY